MKHKPLIIIMVVLMALTAWAAPLRTHLAGTFRPVESLEGDERKAIKDNESIVFGDTALADLNLDGLKDRVIRKGGLHIEFLQSDNSVKTLTLSDDDGKVAVWDVNGDGVPDILQNSGGLLTGGIHYYANVAIQRLQPDMIPISEDRSAFVPYTNRSDSLAIVYTPMIDSPYLYAQSDSHGVRLVPMADWHGTAALTIAYEYESLRDTAVYPVVVLPVNDAPVILGDPDTLWTDEDMPADISIDSLHLLVTDPDTGTVLTFLRKMKDGQLVPVQGTDTYIPAENASGPDSLVYLVSDGLLADTLKMPVVVRPVNDAPVWSELPAVEFPEDEYDQLPLSWLDGYVSDVETPDSLLRFYVYSGMHVAISAEGGKLTLMGDQDWFGTDLVRLVVSDGELRDTVLWEIRITPVNDAPVLAVLPDTMFYEDGELILDHTILASFAHDVETPAKDLKWQVRRFGKIRAHYNGMRIRCKASDDWFGTDSLELTVSDGELTASRIWRIHVLPVNDPPRFGKSMRAQTFMEDDSLIIQKRDLYKMVRDPETRSRDLNWTLTVPEHLTVKDRPSSYLFTADPNWYGNVTVRIAVDDGEYGDTLDQLVRVLSVNDKPVMNDLPPKAWNEDDTLSLDFNYLESFASDIETKPKDLIWSFIRDPHVGIRERKTAITLVPDADWNGDARIGMIVYDGGLRDTGYMAITIKPVNDAPRWAALPDTSINEDGSMTLPLSFIKKFVTDPDIGDEIKLEYKVGNKFFVEEKSDTLEIWPPQDWYGNETIEFTASDGKKKVKATWNIPVLSVNDPPYFTMDLPDSISFKANGSDTLYFNQIVYDVDNNVSDLTWEVSQGKIVRNTIDEKKGYVIFYTQNYQYGEDGVTLRVSDGHDEITYYLPIFVHEIDRFLMANPVKLELLPNTPNPFRDYTDIRYSLPVGAQVSIKIYNLLGKEINELADGYHDAQNYSVRWYGDTYSGMPAPSGVYLCRMVAVVEGEPVIQMQKMMLVR